MRLAKAVPRSLLGAVLVLLLGGGLVSHGTAREQQAPPARDQRPAFLPLVIRSGHNPQPTLGPSPTPTRTPAAGPSPTPTVTPSADFDVRQAVHPSTGIVGTPFIFTVGLINPHDVPVQVALVNALPEGLLLEQVWPPTGTVVLVAGNTFTVSLTVPRRWTHNLFFAAVAAPPCPTSCHVRNSAAWSATWAGGTSSGTSSSPPIWLLNVTPTPAPATPTRTPAPFPTGSPSPTAGPPTPPPTLGPSPTPGG